MKFMCQNDALDQLSELASHDRHSVLIEGVPGSGKTYLARQYAALLHIDDFQLVDPTVGVIREAIESCYKLSTPVVLCIENLDSGVAAASYALLKFLEEPSSNVYIVVTCTNINKVPDTIISRSVCVTTAPPIYSDIELYASEKNFARYHELSKCSIWEAVHTFKNVDLVLNMTDAQIDYFNSLGTMLQFNDSISNITWKLGHYSDNTETPIDLVISYIIAISTSPHIKHAGIQCLKELSISRIASHATLAKFAFECKYCE